MGNKHMRIPCVGKELLKMLLNPSLAGEIALDKLAVELNALDRYLEKDFKKLRCT
jgi:hypothetical protein